MHIILLDISDRERWKQEENNFLTDWIIEDCRQLLKKDKEVSTTYYIYEAAKRLRILHSYFSYDEQDDVHAFVLSENFQKCLLARKQKIGYN